MRFLVDAQLLAGLGQMDRQKGHPASAVRVVWLRIGNSTNRVLFAWLEPLWPEVIRQLLHGQPIIEVRRD